MKPKDIWRLYQAEQEATAAEARATTARVLRDPEEARRLIDVLIALAEHDPDPMFKLLRQAFINTAAAELLVPQIAADDAVALRCGAILVALMERMAPAPTPRGRPGKKVRTA